MSKAYEVLRKGGKPSRPLNKYGAAVQLLVDRVPKGDEYQVRRRGRTAWVTVPSKPALKEFLRGKRVAIGDAFYAKRKGGRAIYVLRGINVSPPAPACPDPNATPAIKALWTAVYEATLEAEKHFGRKLDLVFMGIYNCRRIDGSSSWSQHAFRNGLDFRLRRTGAASDSIDIEATTYVVNRVRYKAAEALWRISGHFYHAHLTGDPKRYGTPGCA